MIQPILKKSIRTIITFGLGSALAFGLFFLFEHNDFLQASVLQLQEQNFIKENQWNIAYKQENTFLDIFIDDSVSTNTLTLVLSYSPDILIQKNQFSGQCFPKILEEDTTSLTLELKCSLSNHLESALIIPFSGDKKDILVEKAFSSDTKQSFSIGNLNSFHIHY